MTNELKIEINWALDIDANTAAEVLSKGVSPPVFWLLSRAYSEGPEFQGEINRGKFKIWVKAQRRLPPPASITGEIVSEGATSRIKGCIAVGPILQIVMLRPSFLVMLGAIALITLPMAILNNIGQILINNIVSRLMPIAYMASIGILLLNYRAYVGRQDVNDIKEHIESLLKKHIMAT